jgi:hypothetical protein
MIPDIGDMIQIYVALIVYLFALYEGLYSPWQAIALTLAVAFISAMIVIAVDVVFENILVHLYEEIEKWNGTFGKKYSDLR